MYLSKEVAEKYAASLKDLTFNSKPLIDMLTILAMEYIDQAEVIVETVVNHLERVEPDIKLPVLYLIDSTVKNIGDVYIHKYSRRIIKIFTRTFEQVDETFRSHMFLLRMTWNGVFPETELYQLDIQTKLIDPTWPIYAEVMKHVREPRLVAGPASPVAAVALAPTEVLDVRPHQRDIRQNLLDLRVRAFRLNKRRLARAMKSCRSGGCRTSSSW